MNISTDNKTFMSPRVILFIVLLEYSIFILSGTSFSFLSGDRFFSLQADPLSWLFYMLRIPQFIVGNLWVGIILDATVWCLLIAFILKPGNYKLAVALFVLLLLFYVTLTGYLTHRNYQTGFFLVFIPFMFKKEINKRFAFETARYFLLFFYASAALLKIYNHSLIDPDLLSHLVSGQFTPYFVEGNTGFRTSVNLFLMQHSSVAHFLYISSFLLELSAIAGFFTKRFDHWLAIALISFHLCNWFVMDIAPFGQLSFICLLFLKNKTD